MEVDVAADPQVKTSVSMAGQRVPFRARVESAFLIFRAHRNRIFSDAEGAIAYHNRLVSVLAAHTGLLPHQASVLEVGCGQRATQVALFKADGAQVVGIDIEIPTYRMSIGTVISVLRANGMERCLKSIARHILFDRRFFAELSRLYRKPLPFSGLDTRVMDVEKMSFPDSSFDIVHSAWVLEHVQDARAAVAEVNRVLKPSGIGWMALHLFPSLSGGHHLEWIDPDRSPSTRVPPWDHLRGNTHPVNVYLNKLSLRDYRQIFSQETAVIDEQLTSQGEGLLTPEMAETLRHKGYMREDLLTATATFVFRKKQRGREGPYGFRQGSAGR
jgi:SAM-dependent methyltransferase